MNTATIADRMPAAPARSLQGHQRWSRDEWIARGMLLVVMALLLTFLIAPLFSILFRFGREGQGSCCASSSCAAKLTVGMLPPCGRRTPHGPRHHEITS